MNRREQIEQIKNSEAIPGIKQGIIRRLEDKAVQDRRRQQRREAVAGMHKKRVQYSAGEQFDPAIHVAIDGEPVLNKDGTYRKKPGRKV